MTIPSGPHGRTGTPAPAGAPTSEVDDLRVLDLVWSAVGINRGELAYQAARRAGVLDVDAAVVRLVAAGMLVPGPVLRLTALGAELREITR